MKKNYGVKELCDSEMDQGECCTYIPGVEAALLNNSGTVRGAQCRIPQLFQVHKDKEFLWYPKDEATMEAGRRRVVRYIGAPAKGAETIWNLTDTARRSHVARVVECRRRKSFVC